MKLTTFLPFYYFEGLFALEAQAASLIQAFLRLVYGFQFLDDVLLFLILEMLRSSIIDNRLNLHLS